jgi:putative hydrolase of the HAD superfamily
MMLDFQKPAIIFLDAWHTLFTVRDHGPRRLAIGLESLGLAADDARISAAMAQAREKLKALNLPFVATAAHEEAWFRTLSRLTLEALEVTDAEMLADRLSAATHYVPYCTLYEDTLPALEGLKARGYRLGVLSNAYPSLLDALARLGVTDYFDLIVVSAFEGCEKPEAAIYRAALRTAEVAPEAALFVDDQPANVEAADTLGMVGVLIDRDGQHTASPLRRIARLTDLLPLVDR